jgi:hypothetical protein
MATPNALKALGPCWFRFTDPEDAGKYGGRWYKYDESAILRRRADFLIALETDLGMPVVGVMNGFRASTVLGDTAVAWIGVREVDPARAGDFDDFTPVTMLIEWSKTAPGPGPKDGGLDGLPDPAASPSPTASNSESTNSGQTATVVLSSMPIAES